MFFGPPGSGKGTQADILGKDMGLPVISVGELLRHERDQGSELGREVADRLAAGKLVPDELVEQILDKRFAQNDITPGFILDGYPRKKHQLDLLEERFETMLGQEDKIAVIHIDLDDKEVKRRVTGRRVCDCGASYHLEFNPPAKQDVCDHCGARLYRRRDDEPHVVADRLQSYHERIQPLLDHLKKHYTVITINGKETIKEEKEDIKKGLEKMDFFKY